jgi:hypothetical protein
MNSTLSFDSSADHKNFLKNKVVPAIKKALPVVNTVLSVGCKVGTVASVAFPAVAPIAGGVCTASKVSGIINGAVNRR